MANSARDSVMSSPELRELVLLQLDLRTLLHAQRVCRTWQHSTSSPRVQEALFFRPVSASPPPQTPASASSTVVPAPPDDDRAPWELNPLLARHFPAWFAPRWSWKERYELEASAPWTRDAAGRERFLRPEASWRRMLPSRPAPAELRVVTRVHLGPENTRRGRLATAGMTNTGRDKRTSADGDAPVTTKTSGLPRHRKSDWNGSDINMGVVYHLTQTYLRSRVVSYFCVLWPGCMQPELDGAAGLKGMRHRPPPPGGATTQGLDMPRSSRLMLDAAVHARGEAEDACLMIVFEQLWNWFERGDTTGDWLEEQNAVFAKLNLREYAGPSLWDEGAVVWDDEQEEERPP